jgi:hypothetical protein
MPNQPGGHSLQFSLIKFVVVLYGSIWLQLYNKKEIDIRDKIIFDWRNKDKNIKINISLKKFRVNFCTSRIGDTWGTVSTPKLSN